MQAGTCWSTRSTRSGPFSTSREPSAGNETNALRGRLSMRTIGSIGAAAYEPCGRDELDSITGFHEPQFRASRMDKRRPGKPDMKLRHVVLFGFANGPDRAAIANV